ncbi:hypothetical protein OTU49_013622 [Cherax quadricarinatus]|uniref:Methyltransferase type 11 domain-containing protein n=1 Tax=Cherax quadricarinatus TaxID=27406 RepID=A0AAW0VSV6_CHEQU
MEKVVYALSGATAVSACVAAWAVYKWVCTRSALRAYTHVYTDAREVQRYLEHHYGSLADLSELKDIVPEEAVDYQRRLADFCGVACERWQVAKDRVLDVGCGPGGLSFHLSRHFRQVIGTDVSYEMITAAQTLKQFGEFAVSFPSEGGNHVSFHSIRVPDDSSRERVEFWDEDACALAYTCGTFDCVVASNVLTVMYDPKSFLQDIHRYVTNGGLLVVGDAYDWKSGPEVLLGGWGEMMTPTLLRNILESSWSLVEETSMAYYVPRCQRLAIIGNAHFTIWKKKQDDDSQD